MGHGSAERASRRAWETEPVFTMPADGRAGRRDGSTSVEDHPDASGHSYPLRGEQHFPADLSGWPSSPKDPDPRWMGYSMDGGKATRWSSTAADSGKAVGSIVWA